MTNQQSDITLESIAQQKEALRKQIDAQQQKVSALSHSFMAPLKPAAQKGSAALGLFNRGMVVFDGILVGYRIFRKFRKLFR